MALRNISLYSKISFKNTVSKNQMLCFPNYLDNGLINLKFQHQSIRRYHISDRQYVSLSRSLFLSNPLNRPDLSSTKPGTDIPPIIEPNKINEVLSEVRNRSQIKLSNINETSVANKIDVVNETSSNEAVNKSVAKLSLIQKIKRELIHYYHGFRLLFLEVKVTGGILVSVLRGHTLTRRERKQLVRTVADLARMVPFAVFIIVPFMEFLLPIYIKFFPFMMPSTFQERSKEEEKTRQLLKGKLEMAKFLQDTLEETRNVSKYSSEANISLESFNQFMKQVREAGHTANTDDIVKFSRLFEDEVTLESLEHRQLKALCKLLELNSVGPKALLSFHLRMRVHQLKIDDKMIAKEGIDKIPAWELQLLCRERGMRAIGVSEERLRFQLSQWLKLSIVKQVPISLLLMSRTMYLPEHLSAEEQLTKAIFHLPQIASKEASLRTASSTEKFDNKTKFELIKEEQEAILKEKKVAKHTVVINVEKETLVDKAPVINVSKDYVISDSLEKTKVLDESISTSDLNQIETAIESIEDTKTALQEEELEELKEQAAELQVEVVHVKGAKDATHKLSKRLQYMIDDMDSLLNKLRAKKETIIRDIDATPSSETDEERVIAITDVMKALKQLKSVSGDETKWQRILEILDEDHDGHIEARHVTEVLDLLGSDEVKISKKEMARVLNAIDKEDEIDKEESQQKN